jgi:hypothetical protein
MLRGDAYPGRNQVAVLLKLPNDWSHFDGFRTGSKYAQYFHLLSEPALGAQFPICIFQFSIFNAFNPPQLKQGENERFALLLPAG